MKIGDCVSRISYNHDIKFIILEIKDNIAYLKGTDIRLYADATLDDLVLSDKVDDYRPTIDNELLDRDEYFYLPGRILHIDAIWALCNCSRRFDFFLILWYIITQIFKKGEIMQ